MRFGECRSSFRGAACLALAILLGSSPSAIALTVEAVAEAGSARLRLLWPVPVAAAANASQGAIVVTVDRDVDPQAIKDATAMLPDWVASATAEGRAIRIVPVAGTSVETVSLLRGVEIRLAGVQAPAGQVAEVVDVEEPLSDAEPATAQAPTTDDTEAAAAARRLRISKARLLMETGDPQGAKRELEQLRTEVPNSIEVMSALAGVEAQLGRWRRAIGLYDSILDLNPDDPALARAKAELLREYGPRFRLDLDHRKVRDADRQIVARATGEAIAGMSTVGFALEGVDLKTPAVQRPDGTIESFQGRRARGEAYVSFEHDDGGITRPSVIGGNGIVGAALRHARPFAGGTGRVALIAQDPYWDVVDGLVNEARSDRIQIGYERLLGTNWRFSGRVSVGRYGIDGNADVARFISPQMELAYTLLQGPPSLTIGYGLDAEYLGGRETGVDAFGLEYPLLSVVSREVHSGTVGLAGTIGRDVRYNLFGGWAYDRLNADGPFVGADVAYEPMVNFEVGLAASYSLATSRGSDATVTRFGGYMLWRF